MRMMRIDRRIHPHGQPYVVVRVTSVKSVLRESHNITSTASRDTNNNPRKCPKTNCHSSGSNTTMKCEGLFNYTNYSEKTFQTSLYRTQLVYFEWIGRSCHGSREPLWERGVGGRLRAGRAVLGLIWRRRRRWRRCLGSYGGARRGEGGGCRRDPRHRIRIVIWFLPSDIVLYL